jgi:hypothetical protein
MAASLPGLAEFLAAVPDHRRAQGRRHSLVSILGLSCAATVAGAKSLVAIAEWAADAPAAVLAVLGVRRDPCGGALLVPSETTIRRALPDTDAAALDEQLAAWLAAATVPEADEVAVARVMADGKTMRGAVQADGRAVHLLAAMSGGGAVLAQREAGHKTNEITQLKPLLDPLPLDGAVITLDALYQRRHKASKVTTAPARSRGSRSSGHSGQDMADKPSPADAHGGPADGYHHRYFQRGGEAEHPPDQLRAVPQVLCHVQ